MELRVMEGVREYGDGLPVEIGQVDGRPVIIALNEAGCCLTSVDLLDVLEWVKIHGNEISSLTEH